MDLRGIKEFLKDTINYIIFIIIILFIAIYVIGLQQVVGPSMNPTYNDKDIMIIDKISYKFIDIERNDIISFSNPTSKYFIKRVIGLPGDSIEFKDNQLYINDEIVIEDYLLDGTITEDFKLSDIGYDIIPEDMYFVLGDNRENSQDSRDIDIGLIKKEDIVGRKLIKIWPIK